MDAAEMLRLFESHREAKAAPDIDAILETFVSDCFLETVPLGFEVRARTRSGRHMRRSSSRAFPDLAPDDERMAVGDGVIAVWGTLRRTTFIRRIHPSGADRA
jgi:hypothetical protein